MSFRVPLRRLAEVPLPPFLVMPALLLAVGALPLPGPLGPLAVQAQTPLGGESHPSLGLTGYMHFLTGIHDTGYDLPLRDRRSGFHSELIRLRWSTTLTDRVSLDVHHRAQARISTSNAGIREAAAGIGVTAIPGQAVDLRSIWVDDERLRADHDFDRLAVSALTPVADFTLGRQAITWGTSLLFPVADLWAPFSPFELDTDEKPGIDALRALAYPADGLELDMVVADRGEQDDWSAGVRATWSLSSADAYASVSRVWNELLLGGGVSRLFDTFTTRAEILVPRDRDSESWLDPRFTAGVDWLGTSATLTAEYHFNGLGASDPDGYEERAARESFQRGETYFFGRHYLGASTSWTPGEAERVTLSCTILVNLSDASASFLPTVLWDAGSALRITFGGLVGMGDSPELVDAVPGGEPTMTPGSEYGSYGNLGFTQVSVYF